MTYDEVPPIQRHTWAVYEAFRKLGFQDDDITFVVSRVMSPNGVMSTDEHLVVALKAQGKQFTVVVMPLEDSFEETRNMLERVRLAIRDKAISDADLQRMWNESKMADKGCFMEFTCALLAGGFVIPALELAN